MVDDAGERLVAVVAQVEQEQPGGDPRADSQVHAPAQVTVRLTVLGAQVKGERPGPGISIYLGDFGER